VQINPFEKAQSPIRLKGELQGSVINNIKKICRTPWEPCAILMALREFKEGFETFEKFLRQSV